MSWLRDFCHCFLKNNGRDFRQNEIDNIVRVSCGPIWPQVNTLEDSLLVYVMLCSSFHLEGNRGDTEELEGVGEVGVATDATSLLPVLFPLFPVFPHGEYACPFSLSPVELRFVLCVSQVPCFNLICQ